MNAVPTNQAEDTKMKTTTKASEIQKGQAIRVTRYKTPFVLRVERIEAQLETRQAGAVDLDGMNQ